MDRATIRLVSIGRQIQKGRVRIPDNYSFPNRVTHISSLVVDEAEEVNGIFERRLILDHLASKPWLNR
jgi:hypothetical protein